MTDSLTDRMVAAVRGVDPSIDAGLALTIIDSTDPRLLDYGSMGVLSQRIGALLDANIYRLSSRERLVRQRRAAEIAEVLCRIRAENLAATR